eukprot:tig00000113_g5673.t1
MVRATDSQIVLAPTNEWFGVPSYSADYRAPGVIYRKEQAPNRGGGAGGGAFDGLQANYERTRATHYVTNTRAAFADRSAQRVVSSSIPRDAQTKSSVVLGQDDLGGGLYQTHHASVYNPVSERHAHPYDSRPVQRPVQQHPPYDLINGGEAKPRRLKEGYQPSLPAGRKAIRLEPVEAKVGHPSFGMTYNSIDGRMMKKPPPPLPSKVFTERPPLNSLGALRPPL